MSKSPMKDFSRLMETNAKTTKKEDPRRDEALYVNMQQRYESMSIVNELKNKLDAALRHNTRLLEENSTLGEMVNELRYELKSVNQNYAFFQRQSDDLMRKTSGERQNLILEVEMKQRSHEQELAKLLRQISTLHEEKNSFEIERQNEMEKIKNQFEANLLTQLQNVRNCQNNSKDLYQTQIRNLKDLLEQKEYEIENVKSLERMEKMRLSDNIKALEKEIKHIRNANSIQVQGLKNGFENDISSLKKQLQNERDLQVSSYSLKLKKLKKDVTQKNLELQHTSKKMSHQEQLLSIESTQFKKQKQSLLSELKSNDIHSRNILTREKNKLDELNKLQVENLTKLFETNIEELNGENSKLKQLIQCKKEQLKQLYDQNQRIKESYGKEIDLFRSQNTDLKTKIKGLQLQNKEQIQTFKVKMANLLQNDIKCMSNYYENQLRAYIDKVAEYEKINIGLRQKLFKNLQQNDQIRKNFEIQISKQRARVQDLKIKMASLSVEHKEHVSNLGSKVQLTSQTLIRQTEHQQKTKGQYQEEKRKYHYLTNSKDKQITDLMTMMQNMKRMHEDELKVLRAQKMQFKQDLDEAELQNKRIRVQAEDELKKKDEKLKTLVVSNEQQIQEIKDLQDKIQVLEKNAIKVKKQLQHFQLINSSLAQELGLSKGFIESLQLQSNAAIEDERSKLKAFLGTHQISIRQYFEDKLKSKQKDVESLQKMLAQKQDDIRELIVKYNALQKRLDLMMQTQTKLREFEQKVKCLGLDNNLVKNMAQLFKK